MEINAAIIHEPGNFPAIGKIDLSVPANHINAYVKASALNHRDLWIANGQYAGIKYPMVLGSDGCVEYNDQLYIINPGINWGANPHYHSSDFKILGLPDFGTFADHIAIPKEYLYLKPEHLSVIEAAVLPLAGLTAYRALFVRAQLQKTDKVFISGIGGGVALFALQFAIANGNDVFVSSSSEEKIERAKSLGAMAGFNYRDEQMSKNILNSFGPMDVIIDSAGGKGFNNLVSITNKGARIAIYGGTAGKMEVTPQKVFWNQIDILGTTMGSQDDFKNMVNFVNRHKIVPVVDKVFPIQEIHQAFERMKESKQFGKIALINSFQ